ncbi:MAG: S-methyl-5'-thioinosine phosphorylase [Solirubrobacterales bacterium]
MLAVIGGSGLYSLEGLAVDDHRLIETEHGSPSGEVVTGSFGGSQLAFIARHGADHSIAPHQVNYRANLKALESVGATRILGVSTVGGISPGCVPGALVVPDQIIDYTWGREHTFNPPGVAVNHEDFTWPYAPGWRQEVLMELSLASIEPELIVDGGTLGVTQGPRLETAAEVTKLAQDGCGLVGMTGMPEAILARELGIDYAAVCPVVNRAAGLDGVSLDVDAMGDVLREALTPLQGLIAGLA